MLFGVGVAGGPQQSKSSWHRRILPEAHLARITSSLYIATTPFWPDEAGPTTRYNPSIDISYLGSLQDVALRPGRQLSAGLVEALRSSGIHRQARRTRTEGSPALAAHAPVLASALHRPRGSNARSSRSSKATAYFAPIPKKAKDITVTQPSPPVSRTIERREQGLVDRYRNHMEAKGHSIVCIKIPDGKGNTLSNDIYDKDLHALIEAKGSSDRNSVRMALGQILDYQRHATPKHRGVLLPDKPIQDLIDLLEANGVTTIWETVRGFSDSDGGPLV